MLKKFSCPVLSFFLGFAGFVAPIDAAVIATSDAFSAKARMGQLNEVQQTLAREDVQAAMISLGVDPVQAQLRVAALSQAELARLSGQLDRLPAGGDVLALIGAVFVVLLILELTGVTNIFTNI